MRLLLSRAESASANRLALPGTGVLFEMCPECFNLAPLPQQNHKYSLMRRARERTIRGPDDMLSERELTIAARRVSSRMYSDVGLIAEPTVGAAPAISCASLHLETPLSRAPYLNGRPKHRFPSGHTQDHGETLAISDN